MKRTLSIVIIASIISSFSTVLLYKYLNPPERIVIRESSQAKFTDYTERLLSGVAQRQFLSSSPTNFTAAAGQVTPAVVNIRATTESDFDLWGGYSGSTG